MLRTHNIASRKFFSLFLNIVKRGNGVETRNCNFSQNFCHWWSAKNLKKLSVVFYSWFFWITLKASNCPLRHYDISLNKFWSPNKQFKYLGRWGKIFIFQIVFKENKIISITKKIPQDASLHIGLFHQEHKCPICIIRTRYPETKNCPNDSFSNKFCQWILNNKETFLLCF